MKHVVCLVRFWQISDYTSRAFVAVAATISASAAAEIILRPPFSMASLAGASQRPREEVEPERRDTPAAQKHTRTSDASMDGCIVEHQSLSGTLAKNLSDGRRVLLQCQVHFSASQCTVEQCILTQSCAKLLLS